MHATCGSQENNSNHGKTDKEFDIACSLFMRRQASDSPQVGYGDSGKSDGDDDSYHDGVLLKRRYARSAIEQTFWPTAL
jgi:hypothetical protein